MAQSTPPNPRQAAGGAFQVINVVDMEADNTPPGRVTDLQAENQHDVVSIKFTAPGDDLDSNDKVRVYILKFSSTAGNLTGPNFNDDVYNTEIKNEDLVDSTLEPETGGIQKILLVGRPIAPTIVGFFPTAMASQVNRRTPGRDV